MEGGKRRRPDESDVDGAPSRETPKRRASDNTPMHAAITFAPHTPPGNIVVASSALPRTASQSSGRVSRANSSSSSSSKKLPLESPAIRRSVSASCRQGGASEEVAEVRRIAQSVPLPSNSSMRSAYQALPESHQAAVVRAVPPFQDSLSPQLQDSLSETHARTSSALRSSSAHSDVGRRRPPQRESQGAGGILGTEQHLVSARERNGEHRIIEEEEEEEEAEKHSEDVDVWVPCCALLLQCLVIIFEMCPDAGAVVMGTATAIATTVIAAALTQRQRSKAWQAWQAHNAEPVPVAVPLTLLLAALLVIFIMLMAPPKAEPGSLLTTASLPTPDTPTPANDSQSVSATGASRGVFSAALRAARTRLWGKNKKKMEEIVTPLPNSSHTNTRPSSAGEEHLVRRADVSIRQQHTSADALQQPLQRISALRCIAYALVWLAIIVGIPLLAASPQVELVTTQLRFLF